MTKSTYAWQSLTNVLGGGGACSACVGEAIYIQYFGREIVGKDTLGRPRCRWEGNITLDLQEVGCGGMDWVELAQDRDR